MSAIFRENPPFFPQKLCVQTVGNNHLNVFFVKRLNNFDSVYRNLYNFKSIDFLLTIYQFKSIDFLWTIYQLKSTIKKHYITHGPNWPQPLKLTLHHFQVAPTDLLCVWTKRKILIQDCLFVSSDVHQKTTQQTIKEGKLRNTKGPK